MHELVRDVCSYDAPRPHPAPSTGTRARLRRKLNPDRGRFVISCRRVPDRYLLAALRIEVE